MAVLKRWAPVVALAGALFLAGSRAEARPARAPVAAASPHGPSRRGAGAPRHARVAARRKGAPAVSVGYPNDGRLDGGAHLDTKLPFVRVVPAYASGDVRWGLPALVGMIERAARTVHKRYPGSILNVGDLSQRDGGDLLRHHSHESGRDADLGFYIVDAKGKPVLRRTFTRVAPDLSVPDVPGARFDLDRNWLFLEALLLDPRARVSHVFVMTEVKQHLLAYAHKHGASRALLDRAAVVMMQPTDSISHDDHYHVRISCPASMGACIEYSKNAPMGAGRLARGDGKHGPRALRVPHMGKRDRAGALAKAAEDAAAARGHAPAAVASRGAAGAAGPRALSRVAPSLSSHVPSLSLRVPSLSHAAPPSGADADEAEADGDEVKQVLDDSGFVKITD